MAKESWVEINKDVCVATHFHEIGIFKPDDVDACLIMSINGAHTTEELESLRQAIDGLDSKDLTIAVKGLNPTETVVLSILNNSCRDFSKCPIEGLLQTIASKPQESVVEVSIYPTYVSRPRL